MDPKRTSMQAHDALYAQHMAAAQERWQNAVEDVKSYLNHTDVLVRRVAVRLLTIDSHSLWCVLGADTPALHGYAPPYTPVARMEFVCFFVGHELLDDGDPGVGYYRYGRFGDRVLCAADAEGAIPYFHSRVDTLRRTYPNAELLTADRALEILEWHAARHTEYVAWAREEESEDTSLETGAAAVQDRLVAQLATELTEETA